MGFPFLLLLLCGSAGILILEWVVWRMFAKKINGIHFPHSSDASHFAFFTVKRLRLCAVAHTVFLVSCLAGSLLLTW